MLLQSVRHDVKVQAGHVRDVDAQLEDFRPAVDDDPVDVHGSDQVFPVRKFAGAVRSCHRIQNPIERIGGDVIRRIFVFSRIRSGVLGRCGFEAVLGLPET